MSFATAAHRLGASAITLSVERSLGRQGRDAGGYRANLNAMRPDALVIRHRENGAPAVVAEIMEAPVLNAGDGTNEHPTQALLDAATHPAPARPHRRPQGRDLRGHPPQPRRTIECEAVAQARRRGAAGGSARAAAGRRSAAVDR